MARVALMRVNDAFKPLLKEVEDTKKKGIRLLKLATLAAVEAMMANTPVWEGKTVRNYGIGIGKTGRRSVVKEIGSGDPGHTNKMPLGPEPRRAANEAAARAEITSALDSLREIKNIVIFNSVPADEWDNIENARWPATRKPWRVRNQAVVSKLGEQKAKQQLSAKQ